MVTLLTDGNSNFHQNIVFLSTRLLSYDIYMSRGYICAKCVVECCSITKLGVITLFDVLPFLDL